jgi:hypothetical protein
LLLMANNTAAAGSPITSTASLSSSYQSKP